MRKGTKIKAIPDIKTEKYDIAKYIVYGVYSEVFLDMYYHKLKFNIFVCLFFLIK